MSFSGVRRTSKKRKTFNANSGSNWTEKQKNVCRRDKWRNLEIDYFSMVQINAIRVRLAVAAVLNRVFKNVQANMATGVL